MWSRLKFYADQELVIGGYIPGAHKFDALLVGYYKNDRRGAAMKLCCWLQPKLVAQVGLREWAEDGHMRHSTFLGLREDKNPREAVREQPSPDVD